MDGWMDRSGLRVAAVLASGIVAGSLLVPRLADACSCIGEANIIVPALDEQHPANAALLLDAWCFSGGFEIFSATVDEVPVTLAFEWLYADGLNVATIDPPPQPGQVVAVRRCGDAQGSGCEPGATIEQVLQYTAGPVDDVVPPGVGEVTLHHETGEFEVGCLRFAALQYHVAVSGLHPAAGADLLYMIELRDSGGEIVGATVVHAHDPTPSFDTSFALTTVPDDVADHCVTVTARDLSGNSTLVAELCGSESLNPGGGTGTDGGSDTGDVPPGDDSDGDGSDDGSDPPADGTSTGGPVGTSTHDPDADGGLGDRGCSCRANTATPGVSWLVLFALAARRRRSSESLGRSGRPAPRAQS